MNETRLRTIEQIEQFLSTSEQIAFAAHGDDSDRYEHISRVLKRFDFPQRSKRERGVLRVYLQRTTGYSRAQVTRLVTQWHDNRLAAVPLKKRYRAPVVPFARKYSRRCMPDVEGPLSKSLKVAFGHEVVVRRTTNRPFRFCVMGFGD